MKQYVSREVSVVKSKDDLYKEMGCILSNGIHHFNGGAIDPARFLAFVMPSLTIVVEAAITHENKSIPDTHAEEKEHMVYKNKLRVVQRNLTDALAALNRELGNV